MAESDDYDPIKDVWASVSYAYEAIRERQRNGGAGWIPRMSRVIQGDCREVLKTLPADSIHCCVTSPPYWGLRDYGVSGQIGLEATFTDFVAEMVTVFREVRRVLRPDGTLWLNLGDSYAGGKVGRADHGIDDPTVKLQGNSRGAAHCGHAVQRPVTDGLKPKDLCGIPWRVAFALQEDGWWLRQDIIWSKPNPMPESVTDRCTKAHEYIFLMSKSERYYYDADAIKENAQSDHGAGNSMDGYHKRIIANSPLSGGTKPQAPWNDLGGKRNKRSVWQIATAPFAEAHFATFPPALVEPCILAGCPKGGTVLDPFGGAGTIALVADRKQRNGIIIELNPTYVEMAKRRIYGDAPLLASEPDLFIEPPPPPKQEKLAL